MIPQFVRAVRELAPRAFILENVRGLLRTGFRSYFSSFSSVVLQLTHPTLVRRDDESWEEHLVRLESLHTSGRDDGLRYHVVYRVLNAADFGVPQTRERVFIVGFRADLGIEWSFPEPTHGREELLREQRSDGPYWERHDVPSDHRTSFGVRGIGVRPSPMPLFP